MNGEEKYKPFVKVEDPPIELEDEDKIGLTAEDKLNLVRTRGIYKDEQHSIDDLTGAKIHAEFDKKLRQELERFQSEFSTESRKQLAVIFIDIDHFKQVNDKWGHHVGNEVLKGVAKVFMDSVGREDIVVRWGGEEFAILLHEADIHTAAKKAEELRTKVAELAFPDPKLKVTASFGVISTATTTDARKLVTEADAALFRAKNGGRNRVEIVP